MLCRCISITAAGPTFKNLGASGGVERSGAEIVLHVMYQSEAYGTHCDDGVGHPFGTRCISLLLLCCLKVVFPF